MFAPGQTMYARAASQMARHECEFCGRKLTATQGVSRGICDSIECHHRMIEKVGTELLARKRKENAAYRDRMFAENAEPVAAAKAAIGADGPVATAVVPYQEKRPVPLPADRRDAFARHMRAIAEMAFAEPAPEADLSYREDLEAPEAGYLAAACASCRGGCCEIGGDTACLSYVDVMRYRQRAPQATIEAVIEDYVSRVPAAAVEGSCVYHTQRGCALPRDLRNDQCNEFHCRALKTLKEVWEEAGSGHAVVIAADQGEMRNVAGYSDAAGRVEVAERPSAPAAEG